MRKSMLVGGKRRKTKKYKFINLKWNTTTQKEIDYSPLQTLIYCYLMDQMVGRFLWQNAFDGKILSSCRREKGQQQRHSSSLEPIEGGAIANFLN